MSGAQTPVLLFDLGGVLIDNITFEELPKLLPAPEADRPLFDRWLTSNAVRRYESGQITSAAFGEAFVAEWGLTASADEFLTRFAGWPTAPFPGVMSRLADLKTRHELGLLSNCNPVHWERLTEVRAMVDHAFSSHELGLVKPDPEVFAHVVAKIGRPADQIIFFDDSATNVEAARTCGLQAHQTLGFLELERTLTGLGLVVPIRAL